MLVVYYSNILHFTLTRYQHVVNTLPFEFSLAKTYSQIYMFVLNVADFAKRATLVLHGSFFKFHISIAIVISRYNHALTTPVPIRAKCNPCRTLNRSRYRAREFGNGCVNSFPAHSAINYACMSIQQHLSAMISTRIHEPTCAAFLEA